MKAIETNIHRHENGTFYFVARRKGKLRVRTFGTSDLEEARRILREKGTEYFFSNPVEKRSDAWNGSDQQEKKRKARAAEPSHVDPGVSSEERKPLPAVVVQTAPLIKKGISLEEVLNKHDAKLTFTEPGTLKMIQTSRNVILRFSDGLEGFSCIAVWKEYRANGLRPTKRAVGAAANHLRWYFSHFIPWCVGEGYLPESQLKELKKIKKIKVNPRRVRVTEPKKIEELLKMVESEDPDGGAFLRFLACSGARRGSAAALSWSDVDFVEREATFRQRDGRTEVIPLSDEALSILEIRKGRDKPFEMDIKAIERLERRMKRFAKGLEIDLTFFHAFRHNFASLALLSDLNPKEVARLLGHNDGGVLVLKTYGHLCDKHLKAAVQGLRITPERIHGNAV